MIARSYLTAYITQEDCYPDENCDSEVSQLWINALNGEVCYIPYEEELSVTTYCHILYELKVNPQQEFDSFYHVYSSFREHHPLQIGIKNREN